MLDLHPEILRKYGKEEFVVLPYEEFVALQELLADVEDLLLLRQAKADDEANAGEPALSLEEVKKRLAL